MTAGVRFFFARHPILRDALIWAGPALVFGAGLRLLFISYLPFAYWGADSRSYFSFAHQLLANHDVSLDEKRRFLYPILMVPVALLPGAPLRWLAVLQHALGVLSLLPLAYIVRKTLAYWRLWILPVTILYAGLPVLVWYEHELLGENVFFAALMWTFAGWVAWVSETRVDRARHLFWWFFVPFAAFLLTKPSGRFVWPGLIVGLLFVVGWRRLEWRQIVPFVLLAAATLFVGSKKQGAWLLYTATFPLTQVDSPLHRDYKAEIRDMVEPLRANAGIYYLQTNGPFQFLENPASQDGRPLWRALQSDGRKKSTLYMDLALEGIKAEPALFAYFSLQRMVASANLSRFTIERFTGESFLARSEHLYAEGERDPSNRVRMAFGLPNHGSIPPYTEFQNQLCSTPGSSREKIVLRWAKTIGHLFDFVRLPDSPLPKTERTISRARPTLLGWWLMAAALFSFQSAYRRTFGVWTIVAAGYLFGVFAVSQPSPRYFAPAWIVIIPLLAVPLDVLAKLLARGIASFAAPKKECDADLGIKVTNSISSRVVEIARDGPPCYVSAFTEGFIIMESTISTAADGERLGHH
jgi:hypothetical protein